MPIFIFGVQFIFFIQIDGSMIRRDIFPLQKTTCLPSRVYLVKKNCLLSDARRSVSFPMDDAADERIISIKTGQ